MTKRWMQWGLGCAVAALSTLNTSSLHADVKLPAIFGDHMVLQQEAALPVWGSAEPGEKVTVTVGTEKASATADAQGKWLVKLKPLPSGTPPVAVTVEGKNKLSFSDVLVGDVWICSGQSNMQFELSRASTAATALPKADDPQLRFFKVTHKTALQPETDVTGKWELCTPDTAKTFSAAAYFFGQDLRASLNRPIGLIETCWSGMPAQAWVSLSGLKTEPALQHYVDKYNENLANYPKALADVPAQEAAFKIAHDKWYTEVNTPYQAALKDWNAAVAKAKAAGQPEPPKPQPSRPFPTTPPDPAGGPSGPTNLFNGMLAPLMPFAIKGAIWYQGEANAGTGGEEYRTLFGRMITDWREKWGQGDFPFLFVQLASWDCAPGLAWPYVRESQLKTLALPNTGMASAVDLSDLQNVKNLHPLDKQEVGKRLALAAKHVAYGQTLVYSGPIYASSKVEGGAIRVNFSQTGGGLILGHPPQLDPAMPWPKDTLIGFEIAGADGNYVPADARIDGNSVVVSSPKVTQPVFVRFAWANVAITNFYNKEGLPAAPFRTDNLPMGMKPSAPEVIPNSPITVSAAPAPATP